MRSQACQRHGQLAMQQVGIGLPKVAFPVEALNPMGSRGEQLSDGRLSVTRTCTEPKRAAS